MNTFNGMKIVASPLIMEVPKLQLSHDFTACSNAMKKHMNDWLREMFGTYLPCYVIGGDTIAMHPKHVAMLRLQNDMYNVKWTAYAPPILLTRRLFWIGCGSQGIACIGKILAYDALSRG